MNAPYDLRHLGTAPLPTTPELSSRLSTAAARASAWLTEACFPFWAKRAAHPRGGFRERVALDGSPLDDDTSRVRVQARQTYVFARAALMGWEPDVARALVRHGVASLLGPCRRDDGLVGRLVRPGLVLADPQPELYDNAFAILALAWASRALENPDLIGEADIMFAQLDVTHANPAGGWNESVPARLPRRQNPHMHLYEASLALAAASGEDRHLERAATLKSLLETRFVDHRSGHLLEYFSDDLTPIPGDASDIIEPGHEFEWAALLDLHARLTRAPQPTTAKMLYATALKSVDARGLTPMSARLDGTPLDASHRTWSQTEALRAHIALAARGDAAAATRAITLMDALFDTHLNAAPAGGWIDHFAPDGAPCVDAITAATGYHLVTAFIDVIEVAELLSAPTHESRA